MDSLAITTLGLFHCVSHRWHRFKTEMQPTLEQRVAMSPIRPCVHTAVASKLGAYNYTVLLKLKPLELKT